MQERESLNHTKWECKYHVIFSTVGRKYIQGQEKEDQRLEQLGLFEGAGRLERLQN